MGVDAHVRTTLGSNYGTLTVCLIWWEQKKEIQVEKTRQKKREWKLQLNKNAPEIPIHTS